MQKISYFVLFFILVIGSFSCSRRGCTDAGAYNYDSTAKVDDGSCLYNSSERISSYGVSIDATQNSEAIIAGSADITENINGSVSNGNKGSFLIKLDGADEVVLDLNFSSFNYSAILQKGIILQDGGFLVANGKIGFTDSSELICLDVLGNPLWSKKIAFTVQQVIETNDNGFYVLSTQSNTLDMNTSHTSQLLRIDAEGGFIWDITIDNLIAKDIVVTEGGGLALVGSGNNGVHVLRYDANGSFISNFNYENQFLEFSPKIQLGTANSLVLSYCYFNTQDEKYYVSNSGIADNGQTLWENNLEGYTSHYIFGEGLLVVNEGVIEKYTLDAELIWSSDISSGQVYDIHEAVNGNIFITGVKQTTLNTEATWLVKLAPSGMLLTDKVL
jgi:hypothetical protein